MPEQLVSINAATETIVVMVRGLSKGFNIFITLSMPQVLFFSSEISALSQIK